MSERPAIMVVRRADFLTPLAPLDSELIRELPAGRPLKAALSQPRRSSQQLRLYRGLLAVVAENLDQDISADTLHSWMKIQLDLVEPVRKRNGEVDWVPKSVAFDKMPHHEFTAYFDRAKALVREKLIPGIGSDALEREARAMLGEDA